MDKNCRVVVATEAPLSSFFKESFPKIEIAQFPGPLIKYNRKGSLTSSVLRQIPSWLIWIRKERKIVKKLAANYGANLIISDNRYGARVKGIRSVFITHQLMIKLPPAISFLEKKTHHLIKNLVTKFDECWIPDFEQPPTLSGDLSHKYRLPKNASFIGIQSRFMVDVEHENKSNFITTPDILIILSGPEPQKSLLKNLLVQLLINTEFRVVIIGAEPTNPANEAKETANLTFYSHLSQHFFKQLIEQTPLIISRSGYTSIMDFWHLHRTALLIPTPGQTEQEYLAKHLKNHFTIISQNELTLSHIKRAYKNSL